MFSCLLKRVLPFTLTFIVGAALGWLFTSHGAVGFTTRLESRPAPFAYGYGHSCRMFRRDLVAETKPLLILFKPDAHWPHELRGVSREDFLPITVRVTFGADGKVQKVETPADLLCCKMDVPKIMVWAAAAKAARQIQFEPETVNSVPISVTKDVEIHFMAD
jgi:hypothetical protein